MLFDDDNLDPTYDPFPGEEDTSYPCSYCNGQGWIPFERSVYDFDPGVPEEFICSYCGGEGRTNTPPEPVEEEDRCCQGSYGERCILSWECPNAPYARRIVNVHLPEHASVRTCNFKQSEFDRLLFTIIRLERDGIAP